MKILFVIDIYATSNNGSSISAQRFVEEMRNQGHEVRVMSTIGDGSKPVDYVLKEFHFYPFVGLCHKYGFAYGSTDKKLMRRAIAWCDIVHFMFPWAITFRGKKIADELGKPSTSAFHVQPENVTSAFNLGNCHWLSKLMYQVWRKAVYDRFDYVHCPSRFIKQQLIEQGYRSHICAISNGIDNDFVYQPKTRTDFASDKYVIAMVGRLAHEKRQDLIIEAVRQSKYADRIQLLFIGRGPLYDDYRKLAEDLPNPPVFGYYPKPELIKKLSQVDLYVHASDMESEAISCIEAIGTGLVPVISDSELSATKQFALDERSLFRAGDAADLARKIDWWIEHPQEKAEMEHAYAEYARQFSLERSVQACLRMFSSAIDLHYASQENSLPSVPAMPALARHTA